ncbi:transcriptional regulator NrdR [Aerococcus urinaehominis]|uniref:Transcriptional repressor NrdR n=1 Tax=Aerococcus urinaehominis TaxID=128944 RepID=A0A120IAZ6_9LACT|nr:transcriptional regulator NrdR [Aerococcus urinaehominis]AMB99611.1 transcriptional regulator NrdR [Aerococcus urinaehominis]SDL87374.1 transcriptional repressor NrdR [Aerococcus urinaehominis]
MQCPKCQASQVKVLDSRPADENRAIRRRRQCQVCGHRFTTYERVESLPLLVIKRDGTREEFSRDKLLRGIVRSCEKRPVSMNQMQEIVNAIEADIREAAKTEVSSTDIGEEVMARLPKVDEAAYIRYASVYRRFEDSTVFLQEIERLRQKQSEE